MRSSTTTVLTLDQTVSTNYVGGTAYIYSDITNLSVNWDSSQPSSSDVYFYLTYNNNTWNDTNKRTLLYKTLKAEGTKDYSNENNSE